MSEPPSLPSFGIAYFGNRYLHHARADLAEIAATGSTFVVHAFSEGDLRWNPGTMRELVEAGAEAGLQSWMTPWGLAGVFGGESPSYAVMNHPEACQRDDEGMPLPALCPRQPAFRDLMQQWLDAVAVTGASVCQWDEPHLARHPGDVDDHWACRCDACQVAFRKETGRDLPTAWNQEVERFVRRLLSDTVAWLTTEARRRGLASSVVLLPDDADADDWYTLAALPGVQYFGVTPYWVLANVGPQDYETYLRRWCERLVKVTSDAEAEPLGWIQAFAIPAGREPEIARGVEVMRETGITTVAVWAHRACAAMSGLAPEDPELVWRTVQDAVATARTST